MKLSTLFQMSAFVSMGLVLPLSGHAQTYSYSGPVNGFFEMLLSDENGPSYGQVPNPGIVGVECQFVTLTDTIYLDPIANTIRQIGFISVSPSTATGTVDGTRQVGGNSVPATLTLNLAVTGGGIAFDTGPLHYFNFPNSTDYSFGPTPSYPALFDGSYSWTTGGQTYSNSFNYQLGLSFTAYNRFSLPNPTSLTLSNPSAFGANGMVVAVANAANGLALSLVTGSTDHNSIAHWTGGITATMIPEPGCFSLFGLGLSVLAFSRRYRR